MQDIDTHDTQFLEKALKLIIDSFGICHNHFC